MMMVGIIFSAIGICIMVVITLWAFDVPIDIFPGRKFESKYPELKFRTFLTLYELKPDSWSLHDSYVTKLGEIVIPPSNELYMYRVRRKEENFGFSKSDTRKYQKWLAKEKAEKEKARKKTENENALRWLISETEKEIEAMHKLAKQEMREAEETLKPIIEKQVQKGDANER